MSFLVSLKVLRLLLAASVAIWLAGGCLLGCENAAMAAQDRSDDSHKTAVEGASCHTARAHAHDCCSRSKAKKHSKIDPRKTESLLALASVPQGMMSDCPLAVNATAVTAKNNSDAADSAPATNADLPLASSTRELPQRHSVAPFLPNRGPTYLRCCVFLI